MNRLLKLLGYRDRDYYGGDFFVRIKRVGREGMEISHTRNGKRLDLKANYIEDKIDVRVPHDLEKGQVSQLVIDLATAFRAMGYGYAISRLVGVEGVPEAERQAAVAELREMGYEIKVSEDRKQIRQKRIEGSTLPDRATALKQASRMIALMQSVHGTRYRTEVLARSEDD
jgi:hypothetical protein